MVALKEQQNEDLRYRTIKKDIWKEMSHLRNLYAKLEDYEKKRKGAKKRESEAYRIKKIESELKKKFPNMEFDKNLLRLVGTMSYKNPPSKDNEIIGKAIAEHYE